MNLIKLIITSLIVSFSSNLFALCDDETNQIDYKLCLSEKAEDSEKEVQKKQQDLFKILTSWKQEADFRDQTITLFTKATKSFESYKDQQCKYEFSSAARGNGGAILAAQCTIRLNQDYLRSLETQMTWY